MPTLAAMFPAEIRGGHCLGLLARASRPSRWLDRLAICILLLAAAPFCEAQLTLSTAPGGVAVTGGNPNYAMNFGNANGLGVGTPTAGATILTGASVTVGGRPQTGVIYRSPLDLQSAGVKPTANFTAVVTTNFSHTFQFAAMICPANGACSSAGGYNVISTNSGAPDTVATAVPDRTTVIANVGIFIGHIDGWNAFAGSDTVVITFKSSNGSTSKTSTLTITITSQTAVQFTLATAPGGLTITPASHHAMNFGNVNGLGIGPAAGLRVSSASGGKLYSTPYLLQPAFCSFSSTRGTLKVYVSTDFAHPSQLELRDSSAAGRRFRAISKSAGSQTTITSAASSGSTVTRYLGLFVSNANGPTIFTGADNATLTYTLVVP